ncbi:MAG: hypothetical protein E7585_09310 [Ruminococcaceae bacterium]|nr:hypothetical protein [Oscillospiraceae bacterium]
MILIAIEAVLHTLLLGSLISAKFYEEREIKRDIETMGKAVLVDGVWQNDRTWTKDVRYEGGYVYYTYVNNTGRPHSPYEYPWIERKVGDAWQLYTDPELREQRYTYVTNRVPAFSERSCSFPVRESCTELLPGEYRIVFYARLSESANGEEAEKRHLIFDQYNPTTVGYFTVTEEMLGS